MQSEKCLRALASAVIIAAAVLASSGAARASTYKIIHEFEVPKRPTGNLTMDAAGNLYGTTSNGGNGGASCATEGPSGCGVVWKLAPNGILTMLYQFTGGADGAFPVAGVIWEAAGNPYGTTENGGDVTACPSFPAGCGVAFKLTPNGHGTWTESVLYSFTGGADGRYPSPG
jgi:hypothetical protein